MGSYTGATRRRRAVPALGASTSATRGSGATRRRRAVPARGASTSATRGSFATYLQRRARRVLDSHPGQREPACGPLGAGGGGAVGGSGWARRRSHQPPAPLRTPPRPPRLLRHPPPPPETRVGDARTIRGSNRLQRLCCATEFTRVPSRLAAAGLRVGNGTDLRVDKCEYLVGNFVLVRRLWWGVLLPDKRGLLSYK